MNIKGTGIHLSYCLNVYPAPDTEQIHANVFEKAVRVRTGLEQNGVNASPFGIGLWIPEYLIDEFSRQDKLSLFRTRLEAEGLYVFTINGFPFGTFHGTKVKKEVYRPDWSVPARFTYTVKLADLLAQLIPEHISGSISTVPVTFGEWADSSVLDEALMFLMKTVVHLRSLRKNRGRHISLALEPEPGCFLQHTDDILDFFSDRVFPAGTALLKEQTGCSAEKAGEIIRDHLGICLDTIHTAVMFEDPAEVIDRLSAEGIRIFKMHLGGAIEIHTETAPPLQILSPFNDEVYLHQTSVRTPAGENLFFTDLPEALEEKPDGIWRVHYHVPLAGSESAGISNTSAEIDSRLIQKASENGVKHFEVEVYTLDIMPGFDGDIEKAMSKDIIHVLNLFKNMDQ